MSDGGITYGSYLRLDRILDAQRPPADGGGLRDLKHHDEMLFVVIHQVYELWFKQILHDLDRARDLLAAPMVPERDIPIVCGAFHRVHEIQRILVGQLSVLETMSPLDFLAFRDALGSASGFQSAQFRELEILAGLRDEARLEYDGASFERRFGAADLSRFERRRKETSIREALERWLVRTPVEEGFVDAYLDAFDRYVERQRAMHAGNAQLSKAEKEAVGRRLDAYVAACREYLTGREAKLHVACLFIAAHRDNALLRWPNRLLDAVCEFEEWLRLWRFRHARMVERMIGLRVGTGGSSGVDYLDATALRYRIFTVVLESRTYLLPTELLPPLRHPERYAFAHERGG
jgi:tryptophan 2,3-dioxygenase